MYISKNYRLQSTWIDLTGAQEYAVLNKSISLRNIFTRYKQGTRSRNTISRMLYCIDYNVQRSTWKDKHIQGCVKHSEENFPKQISMNEVALPDALKQPYLLGRLV